MDTKKALKWLAFWVGLAIIFNTGVYIFLGPQKALEFLGGYIIEQSLSVDNLFLFLLIFASFGISAHYQRRVLNYGIMGAMILRLVFIVLGVAVVNRFHWVLYIFGLLLIISGARMLLKREGGQDFKNSALLRMMGKVIPITHDLEGERFLIRKGKILYATPLLAILVLIEGSDVIFAIDSIPAVFSITTDPLIVYSSNIFAILGLRNLYFLLEKLHRAFRFVKYGVAVILIFTGVKLGILYWHIEIPLVRSITTILAILLVSVLLSVFIPEKALAGKERS
ncbi:MAG: TerC/Alx family metal homeostasis membrane protein [Firmicutes bacterium]|nr:TerC/Alx family metal homeostasis membrane protein [Bacillota bacterium]